MKWAKSKIVVCFLIVTMLSVFSLGDLAASKTLGRINTMIAVLSVFSSTPAYATNGSEPHPDYPDCSAEEAELLAAAAAAGRALNNFLTAVGLLLVATAALIAGIVSPGVGWVMLAWLWGIFYAAVAAVIATGAILTAAIVREYRAGEAVKACQAGGRRLI